MQTGRSVRVISLATAVSLIGDSMLYIVLPLHYREAGLDSLWQVGAVLAFNRLVRLPLGPLTALLIRKLQIRASLLIACILAVGATIGYGFVNGFAVWLVLRGLWGIAWALFRLGGMLAISELTESSNRGKWIGIQRLVPARQHVRNVGRQHFGGSVRISNDIGYTWSRHAGCSSVSFPKLASYCRFRLSLRFSARRKTKS
ncbi:MFS transporter [Paenibacillus alkalitolerans]|uniref:hypothetical protein n=1 Tax=Paenibacillus alkalitolerans TaxID=2799335 RepID=UPI0018F658B6|nr:hypothetical protein [Paenibacillus alkalitolerans]